MQKVEYELAFHGRVLVRASGTENVIRVLLEGENKKQITQLSAKIVEVIESLGSQNLVCMQ